MPERLEEITVKELSLVPKGAHPDTDFVPLAKEAEEVSAEELEKEATEEVVEPVLEKEAEEVVAEVTSVEDLAKEFSSRIDEFSDEQLSAITDAILAKAMPDEDEEEEVAEEEDDLTKRVDCMEKTLAGLTSGLAKGLEALERLEKSLEKEEEPVVEEPEDDSALMKSIDALNDKLASLSGRFRNVEAKAKAALGEDPGE